MVSLDALYLKNEPNFITFAVYFLPIDAIEIWQIRMLAVVSQNAILFIDDGLLFALERLDFNRNRFVIRFSIDCFQHLYNDGHF